MDLTQSINTLHEAMVTEQDPQTIAVLGKCIQALTAEQARMSSQGGQGGDPRQALMQQLQGARG